MVVTLDGRRIEDAGESVTLHELIAAARAQAPVGRIIAGVRINGLELVGDPLAEKLAAPVSASDQIDLDSADPRQVCGEAMRGAADAMDEAAALCDGIVTGLRTQTQPTDALRRLGEALHAWQVLNDALQQSGALLGEDLGARLHEQLTIQQHIAALASWLTELRTSFETRDYVLLADQVEFEMPERIHHWRDVLLSLADELEPKAGLA